MKTDYFNKEMTYTLKEGENFLSLSGVLDHTPLDTPDTPVRLGEILFTMEKDIMKRKELSKQEISLCAWRDEYPEEALRCMLAWNMDKVKDYDISIDGLADRLIGSLETCEPSRLAEDYGIEPIIAFVGKRILEVQTSIPAANLENGAEADNLSVGIKQEC